MSLQQLFLLQIQAFHTAIINDCHRAARPDQTDVMALRLRGNAATLTRLQLTLCAVTQDVDLVPEPPVPVTRVPEPVIEPEPETVAELEPVRKIAPLVARRPSPPPQDHMPSGDALSRFVSRRLELDESPHHVWQDLHEAMPVKRRRNPVLPRQSFRSPSG
jgi:hypothetical protein